MEENLYAKYYSEIGLTRMIENSKNKIDVYKKQKEDIGLSWTERAITNHKRNVDKLIEEEENTLEELKEALKIKQTIGGITNESN